MRDDFLERTAFHMASPWFQRELALQRAAHRARVEAITPDLGAPFRAALDLAVEQAAIEGLDPDEHFLALSPDLDGYPEVFVWGHEQGVDEDFFALPTHANWSVGCDYGSREARTVRVLTRDDGPTGVVVHVATTALSAEGQEVFETLVTDGEARGEDVGTNVETWSGAARVLSSP